MSGAVGSNITTIELTDDRAATFVAVLGPSAAAGGYSSVHRPPVSLTNKLK
jgi:hypothetical protein